MNYTCANHPRNTPASQKAYAFATVLTIWDTPQHGPKVVAFQQLCKPCWFEHQSFGATVRRVVKDSLNKVS